jgi:glycosyltransferase involved in cell wall biosynthesis
MPVNGPTGQPIEVLHFIETLGLGGAEMTLYTLLKYLDRDRVRSRVVTFFGADDSQAGTRSHFVPFVESMGIPVTSLGARRVRGFPQAISRLYQQLRRSPPDLIHTQLFAANIVGRVAGRLARVPVISTIQSLDYEPERLATYTNPGNVIRVGAMLFADKFTARLCCDMMIPVSEAVAASTRRWLKVRPERMRVMYNPVDTGNFVTPEPDARRRIRQRLGIVEDTRVILNVGRIMYAKGQIDLVNAMPEVLASVPNAHMVILGDTANKVCKAALDEAITRLGIGGHCHFPGASDRVGDWLEACDVFVFPSIFEGMGIAMAEAMLCRRPVVAASIVTLAEQIRDNVTGLLVPPQNPHELARAVVRILQDPALATRLGDAAERQAVQSYDPIRYAERMAGIYDHVLGRQGG